MPITINEVTSVAPEPERAATPAPAQQPSVDPAAAVVAVLRTTAVRTDRLRAD